MIVERIYATRASSMHAPYALLTRAFDLTDRTPTGRTTEEPFNEGAAQVRRLVQRDRKELLGNATDILDKYKTEFGDGADEGSAAPSSSSSSSAAPSSSSPFAPSSSSSPFAAGAASPFAAGTSAASPFGTPAARPSRLASIEPKGLTPDMGPDPIMPAPKDTRSWLARITLTQVVSLFI